MNDLKRRVVSLAIIGGALLPAALWAQTTSYTEDFTQATTTNKWYFIHGACLTAGTGSSTTSPGTPPSCTSIFNSYYGNKNPPLRGNTTDYDTALVGGANGASGSTPTFTDPAGQGALRLTNGAIKPNSSSDTNGAWEDGAIWSATPFVAGNGLQITFKTVTYRGNGGGTGGDGADGMSFYLIDATKVTPSSSLWNGVGDIGGSLGYSCSNANNPADGLAGGYIGLGIDEYGNFLDGAALASGTPSGQTQNSGYGNLNGDNSASGYGFYPYGRIGLRGAGSITWNELHNAYPYYYPSSWSGVTGTTLTTDQQLAVANTCITGQVLDYSSSPYASCNLYVNGKTTSPSSSSCPSVVSTSSLSSKGYSTAALLDYAPIAGAYVQFPNSGAGAIKIANETDSARPTGKVNSSGVVDGNIFLYDLKITQNGLLSLSYSLNGGAYSPIITGQSITASNGSLPSSLYFGFAGATGGSTNIHEILCFEADPVTQSASSAAGDQKQSQAVQSTTQDYFAYYDPNDFTGRVTAYPLIDTNGVLTISSLAAWDADCVLTGVTYCSNTGVSGPTSAEAPASRTIVTWNGTGATAATAGTAGVPFEWTSGITTAEQNTLDAGDSTPYNANRLDWLRGGRSNEINSSGVGLFRARDSILGDVVDSSPVWVGPPGSPYAVTWQDRLNPTATMPENSAPYASFLSSNQSRTNVVYVGANDGLLHGFRAGVEDSSGNVSGTNDGYELFAYMPGAILNTVHNATTTSLDLANASYVHNYYVDATPAWGDLYYGSAWHTWLVGGLGAGGAAIYALDITNPSNFSESNASALVKGEWTSATINCSNVTSCGSNLGNTYGTPLVRRLHNGTWAVIFGNGYGSSSGDAGIYVMTISQAATPVFTFYYLSTGTSGTSNGIAFPTSQDVDGDHITDYVYAGDLNGNVWRFDLTSSNPSNWAVTSGGALFKAQSGQSITTPVTVSTTNSSTPQIIINFGTGKRTQFTNTSAATYAPGTQSVYGVWEWNMSAWNALSVAQYASLTQAQFKTATSISSPYTLTYSNLQQQTFSAATTSATSLEVPVTTSNTAFTYESCSTTCTAGKFGWYANFVSTQGATNSSGVGLTEQMVSAPSVQGQGLLFNSTIPANYSLLSCSSPDVDKGVLYLISPSTGGTFIGGGGSTSSTSSSAFNDYKNTQTVGVPVNETGTVAVAKTKEGKTYAIAQDITVAQGQAPGGATLFSLPSNTTASRVTWVQLR
jgi:type IV pilus assembly protein PilY1